MLGLVHRVPVWPRGWFIKARGPLRFVLSPGARGDGSPTLGLLQSCWWLIRMYLGYRVMGPDFLTASAPQSVKAPEFKTAA